MDPRHTDAEDEQFLLNMIAEGQGDVPEQALKTIPTESFPIVFDRYRYRPNRYRSKYVDYLEIFLRVLFVFIF